MTRSSWTREESENTKKCDDDGVEQEDYDDCVDGNVVTNLSLPYDFESLMHYSLRGEG